MGFYSPSTGQLVRRPSNGGQNVPTTFPPNDLPGGNRPSGSANGYPY